MWSLINTLQLNKDTEIQNQDVELQNTRLSAAFTKLIEKFEHVQLRLHQLVYSGSITDTERNSAISCTWNRLNLYYRFATCAIVLTSNPSVHARDALSVVGELRTDGIRYLGADSGAYNRWKTGCDDLRDFVDTLQLNNDVKPQETRLLTVFKELVESFERVRYSLHQLIYSRSIAERDSLIPETRTWLGLYYRFASYAIVSTWLGKTEENSVYVQFNLRTGQSCTTWSHQPIKVPRRYRRT